jgi:hypothetical protein
VSLLDVFDPRWLVHGPAPEGHEYVAVSRSQMREIGVLPPHNRLGNATVMSVDRMHGLWALIKLDAGHRRAT